MQGNRSFGLALRDGFLDDGQAGYETVDLSWLGEDVPAGPSWPEPSEGLEPLGTAYEQLLEIFKDAGAPPLEALIEHGPADLPSTLPGDVAPPGIEVASSTSGIVYSANAFEDFKFAPFAPTLEGQYIMKNVVLLAAAWTLFRFETLARRKS